MVGDYDEKYIVEARSTHTNRIKKGVYPASRFSYLNYNVDPRPYVLELGTWKHPNTHNILKVGINLNYLTDTQIEKLQKLAKRLYNRKTLKSRYSFIKHKLPSIVQYYRTYDESKIRLLTLDKFHSFKPNDTNYQPYTRDKLGDARKAWQSKQLKQSELDNIVKQIEKGVNKKKLPKQSELEPYAYESAHKVGLAIEEEIDKHGYYIKSHHPNAMRNSKKSLAIYNIITEQLIVDDAQNHAYMLNDAGWSYDDTIRFSVENGQFVIRHDWHDNDEVLSISEDIVKSGSITAIIESR